MGRRPCCSKEGLNRGAWTALEDKILRDYIKIHGEGRWRNLPTKAGLKRCGKSCRLRWLNYLRPDIKRGNISHDEEELIIRLHKLLGNRWSLIAGRLPGRTDNEIKNYWNTNLGKKVQGHYTSASTSTYNKHSNQSNEKKKKKKLEVQQSIEAAVPVVRTKALRCTKVFLAPQPRKVEHLETNVAREPSLVEDFVNDKAVESESYDGLSSFTPREDNNSSNFMVDPSIGEICLSELLDSDFSKLFDFDNATGREINNDNNCELSPSSDHCLLFPDEMLEDWTGSDCVQPDVASDIQSLAAFLDSEEDWLAR